MAGNALYDVGLRLRAAELYDMGRGRASIAALLGIPEETVRKWLDIYRSAGIEVLAMMGKKHAAYSLETKLAAVRAVVDEGMTKPEAMTKFGIASPSSLKKWLRAYREEGPEALRPKPKGRPKGSGSPTKEMTREQELERRVRKLEAENAYLKKIDSPEGREALPNREKAVVVSGLSGQYPLVDLLECAGLARSSYYYALSHPKAPTRPELWEAAAEIFSRTANGCGHRQIAMCLRAEQGVRIADKTALKMMHEMGISCGIRRETDYHRYNSYRGKVGKTFENVIGRDFEADGPWQKMGTDVTEFKQPWGKAYFAPIYDFGSKEIVAWSTSLHPDMAQQHELLDEFISRKPEGASPILHSDMGWQYQQAGWCSRLEKAGVVQSMSRKGNCIDNGATEQVFGHMKDELFRGREWLCFEDFKRDLDEYVIHWNTRRRQVKLKGLTPEEFRNQSLCAA